jgi:hypothetical protein
VNIVIASMLALVSSTLMARLFSLDRTRIQHLCIPATGLTIKPGPNHRRTAALARNVG